MRRPQLPTVTREGLCFLVVLGFILAGALVRQINLLLALFALMAGLPLANWWLVRATLRRLDAQRRMPRNVAAGDLFMIEIDLTNKRRRLASWAVTVTDRICRQGSTTAEKPITARALCPYLPAGSMKTESYRGRIMRRGAISFKACNFPRVFLSA